MKKIIKLSESDLMKIVKKVIKEQGVVPPSLLNTSTPITTSGQPTNTLADIVKAAKEMQIVRGKWGVSRDNKKVSFMNDLSFGSKPQKLGTIAIEQVKIPQGENTGNWRLAGSEIVLGKPVEKIVMTKEFPTSLGKMKVKYATPVPTEKIVKVIGIINNKENEYVFDCITGKFKTNLKSNGELERMISQFCKTQP